jgi:hypothetical protein
MRSQRVWIEILFLGIGIACALALLFATLGAAAGAASQSDQAGPITGSQAFEGMVTCSRCVAKHAPGLERSASNCVRVCVHSGASFVLVDAESTYVLDGELDSLKKLAGQRARVVGTRSGKTIQVTSAIASS